MFNRIKAILKRLNCNHSLHEQHTSFHGKIVILTCLNCHKQRVIVKPNWPRK